MQTALASAIDQTHCFNAAGKSYFLTTNKDFQKAADEHKAHDPEGLSVTTEHRHTAHVQRAIWETGKRHVDAPGRGGARGEISRNPNESGAKYVAEKFVDVYAQTYRK